MNNRNYFLSFFKDLTARDFSGSFLIIGEPGVGQKSFAKQIAFILLKTEVDKLNRHPDYFEINGKKLKKQYISVLEIRDLIKKISLSSHQGNYKVVIIEKVENLTTEAANTLLKTLEEPGLKTIFLLTTNKFNQILETIKSRCFKIYLGPIKNSLLEKKLIKSGFDKNTAQEISGYSLGKLRRITKIKSKTDFLNKKNEVLKIFELYFNSDLVQGFEFANQIDKNKKNSKKYLEYLMVFLRDLLLIKLKIININLAFLEKEYLKTSQKYTIKNILDILEKVLAYEKYFRYNVSCKLFFENIFLLLQNLRKIP